ncbi:MAG TPA: anti-sigma factor RsbA family regulatory protein [Gaiellaceae bacterium]|nr:anti-sigma factor RsbA family regulatory protein [Gaiellaceae bacterium]
MTLAASHQDEAFLHEAFLYGDLEELVRKVDAFVREGIEADEPVLVALSSDKNERVRAALGDSGDAVLFADMEEIGANPARIIAVWRDFADTYGAGGQPIRGIGEPIWAGRSDPELAECHRHESLLNLAFADGPAFRLLCPYDVSSLEQHVVAEAERTHPYVSDGGSSRESKRYRGLDAIAEPFAEPLEDPPVDAWEVTFDENSLADVRAIVAEQAGALGLALARTNSFVIAVNEVATNSVRHGGGQGILRIWRDGEALICQVEDRGRIEEPLVGRQRPVLDEAGGRGLWLANQLCDLVQVRSFENGSAVRIHMTRS